MKPVLIPFFWITHSPLYLVSPISLFLFSSISSSTVRGINFFHTRPFHLLSSDCQNLHCTQTFTIFFYFCVQQLCEWSLAKPGQPLTSITTNRAEVPKFYNGSPRTCLFSLDKENQYLLTCNGHRGFIYKVSLDGLIKHLTT